MNLFRHKNENVPEATKATPELTEDEKAIRDIISEVFSTPGLIVHRNSTNLSMRGGLTKRVSSRETPALALEAPSKTGPYRLVQLISREVSVRQGKQEYSTSSSLHVRIMLGFGNPSAPEIIDEILPNTSRTKVYLAGDGKVIEGPGKFETHPGSLEATLKHAEMFREAALRHSVQLDLQPEILPEELIAA